MTDRPVFLYAAVYDDVDDALADYEAVDRVFEYGNVAQPTMDDCARLEWEASGKPVTEAAIIETFFEWSEEKAKFKASQIRSALATLRSLGMEPNGGGPVVSGVGESNLFSGASR